MRINSQAKQVLGSAFLTCLILGSLGASAKAYTITGETILFDDSTDTMSVSQSGGSRLVLSGACPNGESAVCDLTAPTLLSPFVFSVLSTSFVNDGPNNGFLFITESGTSTVSDFFQVDLGTIRFFSSTDISTFGSCTNPSLETCIAETGTIQTAGTITWSDGTRCDDSHTTCVVDTIQFRSDLEAASAVPEPGTLVLFGSGLVSMLGFARRTIFRA